MNNKKEECKSAIHLGGSLFFQFLLCHFIVMMDNYAEQFENFTGENIR